MEERKDIEGYEGIYKISNLGNVMSCERYVKVGGGGTRRVKQRLLKPYKSTGGYLQVNLNNDGEFKPKLIHRLVAIAFIPNPNNLPEVNHKDEDKENNAVENLEWCTPKYNANYGLRNQKMIENKRNTSVNQYDKDGNFIKNWRSLSDACEEYEADISSMIRVCKGKQKTCVGYKWKYA